MQDVFAVQSEVAQRIASALHTRLTAPEKERIEKRPTTSVEAYDLYLQGRELYNRYRKDDNEEAIVLFQKAVALDPQFALGWAGLGGAYGQRAIRFGFPESWVDSGIEASRTALRNDPTLAEGYQALATNLSRQGRLQEALEAARKALASAPGDSYTLHAAAVAELMAGDPARARELFERQVSRNTPGSNAKVYLAYLYRRSGRIEDAEKLLDKTLELHHRLLASGNGYHAVPLEIAFVHAARGDKDEALRWLERARQAGWRGWEQANWSPLFDPLRQDDRFRDLMRRIDEGR